MTMSEKNRALLESLCGVDEPQTVSEFRFAREGVSREDLHDLILTRMFDPLDLVDDETDARIFAAADAIRAHTLQPPHQDARERIAELIAEARSAAQSGLHDGWEEQTSDLITRLADALQAKGAE